jgi:hypothetical protein
MRWEGARRRAGGHSGPGRAPAALMSPRRPCGGWVCCASQGPERAKRLSEAAEGTEGPEGVLGGDAGAGPRRQARALDVGTAVSARKGWWSPVSAHQTLRPRIETQGTRVLGALHSPGGGVSADSDCARAVAV